jgi:hypothetical protein
MAFCPIFSNSSEVAFSGRSAPLDNVLVQVLNGIFITSSSDRRIQ